MVDSIQSKAPNRFYNKYVEYRKQYDKAKSSFDSELASKETSKPKNDAAADKTKPDASSTKPETSTAKSDLGPQSDKNLASESAPKRAQSFGPVSNEPSYSPPAMTASAPVSAPAVNRGAYSKGPVLEDTTASQVMGASAPQQVNVPNMGSASNKMMDRVKEYEPHILAAAARYNIDPNWIAGIIWQESRGNPRAVSHCGAMGLMQLMPGTAQHLGVNNAFDIGQNIDGGAKYLRQMLDTFGGNMSFATAAYNAGPGNVMKHGGIPPFRETQGYVPNVLGFANSFKSSNAFAQQEQSTAIRV